MLKLVLFCLATVALAAGRSSATPAELDTAEELAQQAMANVKQCAATHHISDETVHKLHKPEDLARLTVEPPIQCFVKCLFDHSPITDADGQHLIETNYVAVSTAHGMDAKQIRANFPTCSQLYSTAAECEHLWKMYMCFRGMKY